MWNQLKSAKLSLIVCWIAMVMFAGCLLAMPVIFNLYFMDYRGFTPIVMTRVFKIVMLTCMYLGVLLAICALYGLIKLLNNITKEKVFDGDTATFFDPPNEASHGGPCWAGIELEEPRIVTRIRYFGRAANIVRMYGCVFQGANEADFSDAVEVPIHLIATAEQAYFVPGKGTKILVEGCPDGRNIWTYIIDMDTHTANMFPSNEGVNHIDFDHDEIILATYGYYSEGGRYTYLRAYSPSGHYLRNMSEKEAE